MNDLPYSNLSPLGYINNRIGSDVDTWKIFSDKKGGLYAWPCTKISLIKPNCQVGGFAAHVSNLDEMYAEGNYEESLNGHPFKIEFRNGKYGRWVNVYHPVSHNKLYGSGFPKEVVEALERGEEYINKELGLKYYLHGDDVIVILLTKNGKERRTFSVLGTEIESRNRYFHDMNF